MNINIDSCKTKTNGKKTSRFKCQGLALHSCRSVFSLQIKVCVLLGVTSTWAQHIKEDTELTNEGSNVQFIKNSFLGRGKKDEANPCA